MKLDIMFSKDGNAPFSTADSYGISVNKQTLPESCKRSEFQVKIKINRANSNAREASVALGGLHGPRGSHQEAEAQRDGARHAEGEPGRASGKTHSLNLSRILLRRLTVYQGIYVDTKSFKLFHLHGQTGSAPARTSNMEAPIMLLSGHSGEIYTAKFHPEGNILASAGFDRQICKRRLLNPEPAVVSVMSLSFSLLERVRGVRQFPRHQRRALWRHPGPALQLARQRR